MDSSGRLRRFTKERHPDIIRAAKCNLGMFGIMYDITIQVRQLAAVYGHFWYHVRHHYTGEPTRCGVWTFLVSCTTSLYR